MAASGADAGGDLGRHVGDDLDPPQRHAQLPQLADQVARILVVDLAREDLVPDDQDRGGGVGAARRLHHCTGSWHNRRATLMKTLTCSGCLPFPPLVLLGRHGGVRRLFQPRLRHPAVTTPERTCRRRRSTRTPHDYYCPADAMGGGVCPINFCGTLQTENALLPTRPGTASRGPIRSATAATSAWSARRSPPATPSS